MSSQLTADLKNAKCILYVEDEDTKIYLERLWGGEVPHIALHVAGGKAHVKQLCREAVSEGHSHVFGLVDRDEDKSNYPGWDLLQKEQRVYILPVPELENLLLTPEALVGQEFNSGKSKQTVEEVRDYLQQRLKDRLGWAALKHVLSELWAEYRTDFPLSDKCLTLEAAEEHLLKQPWVSRMRTAHAQLTDEFLSERLREEHQRLETDIQAEQWQSSFPGKEILGGILTKVHRRAKGSEGRHDLLKAIAQWQKANDKQPEAIVKLRAYLLKRIELVPAS